MRVDIPNAKRLVLFLQEETDEEQLKTLTETYREKLNDTSFAKAKVVLTSLISTLSKREVSQLDKVSKELYDWWGGRPNWGAVFTLFTAVLLHNVLSESNYQELTEGLEGFSLE